MKIIIPGGSGQVGTILSRTFHADGHEVVVLSRSAESAPWRVVQWDGRSLGPWTDELENADVLINLAGRSVNCRYHAKNRRTIKQSRIESTNILGEAITNANAPPRLWLQASTATIYAHRHDAANDEDDGILGTIDPVWPDTWQFSFDVASSWEVACIAWNTPATRKVLMRTAFVMSPDRGGPFDVILGMVRKGLGGKNADGKQYVSWIHDRDLIRAIYWLIDRDDLAGPINLASPNPLPNVDFMCDFRKAWGISVGMPAMKWMLEIATFFMRSESELILKSRRVVPKRLLDSGFTFELPTWSKAAKNLCARWRTKS